MKYINWHFVAVMGTLIALVSFNWKYGNETLIFFGFAENKELEIRLKNPVTVQRVYVTPGTKVKEGDLLLEVTRSGLDLEASDLSHEIAKLESQLKLWESNLKGTISRLMAQKTAKEGLIISQIEQLESEMSINKSLIQGLESIAPAKDGTGRSPSDIKIEGLRNELNLAVKPLDSEIRKLRQELNASGNPIKIQIDKLKENIGFVQQEEGELKVLAPADGIVGSVFCLDGEQFPSFQTLMTLYEENPTQVKGYVLESLILKVNMGDSVLVNSEVQEASKLGKVVGMGSRIVEIPERLRKNPVFKTYGREILIEIPPDNNFLQKGKVVLKIIPKEEGVENKLLRAFTSPPTSWAWFYSLMKPKNNSVTEKIKI